MDENQETLEVDEKQLEKWENDLESSPSDSEENQSDEGFELELDYFDSEEQDEKLWKARTGLDNETLTAAIETIVFISDRPLSLEKIRQMIDEDMPLKVIHESLQSLQKEYESKHHGMRLVEVAEGFQFRTKAQYSRFVQDVHRLKAFTLTPSCQEVLAIITYKQPITKQAIEKMRGVDSSHLIRSLIERRLVKTIGRSDDVGKPLQYGTTTEFLEIFSLNNLDDLPSQDELLELVNDNEVGNIEDIKELISSDERKKFFYDEIEELDELSRSIKEISTDTSFIKSLKDEDKKDKEKKSAFELLEDYLFGQKIIDQNEQAMESEVLTTVVEAKVADPEDELFPEHPTLEDEEKELTLALDKAFEKFEETDDLDQKEDELFDKIESATDAGKKVGLDLDFLKDPEDLEDFEGTSENLPENSPDS